MRNTLVLGLLGLLVLIVACQEQVPITSFEECAAAGNPIMESYPRQCSANGQTFVEEVDEVVQAGLAFHECTEEEKLAESCTFQYDPVCAQVDNGVRCITEPCASTNATTFGNACVACAADAYRYYAGVCEEQLFVVCGKTQTGFDPVEYAEQNNGICVDICPANYDPFMTQIGVQLCIPHYGAEQIEQWETCDRSSETCNCVKAYETTTEDEIADAQYRCVPEMYADRLLFRAGVDRLDENGESFVAIA